MRLKPAVGRLVRIGMSKRNAILLGGAIFSLSLGCRRSDSDPVPSNLPGSYLYAGKGSTLRKQWQCSARLDLTPDRHYTLTLDKTIDGNTDPTETNEGSFTVSGDHVVMHEDAKLPRSEEHTSELQSRRDLVCRLLLEKKNNKSIKIYNKIITM